MGGWLRTISFIALVLFRIHLLSRVDIHSLYGGSFLRLGFRIVFVISRLSSIHFTCNFGRAEEYRSLYRGSSNRGCTVVRCNSNCHAITTPTLFFINGISCITGSTCIKVANPKNGRAMQIGLFLQLRCNKGYFFNPSPPGLAGLLGNPSYMCRDNKWVSRNDFKSILTKAPDCMGKNALLHACCKGFLLRFFSSYLEQTVKYTSIKKIDVNCFHQKVSIHI